jgi:hypothetical protein
MVARRPLVLIDGVICELPLGDTLIVGPPQADTFVQLVLHGDSNTPGTELFDAEIDTNDDGISQYVRGSGGVPDGGYPLAGTGLQPNVWPLQHGINYSIDWLAPGNWLAKRILAAGPKVDIIGAGLPGGRIATDTPNLGPTPDGTATENGLVKAEACWSDRAAASPAAVKVPLIVIFGGFNDMLLSASPAEVLANVRGAVANYRALPGYENASFIVAGVTPEHQSTTGGAMIETALRIAAISDANGYYAIMPPGYGGLHIGDEGAAVPGPQNTRDVGFTVMGDVALIALGLAEAVSPNFSVPATVNRVAGTDVGVELPCDQPIYFTEVTAGGSVAQISGDFAATTQSLVPVGGSWPEGTTAITVAYRTGHGLLGTVSFNLAVSEEVSATYYFRDDFNRESTTPSPTGLGEGWQMVPSTAWGAIIDGKAALPWNGSDNTMLAVRDCGHASVKLDAHIIVAGNFKPGIIANANSSGGGVTYYAMGEFRSAFSHHIGDQGELSALADGTYKITIQIDDLNSRAGLSIDDTEIFPLTSPVSGPAFSPSNTYVGFGNNFINDNTRFDNIEPGPLREFAPGADYGDILGSRLVGWFEADDLSNGAVSSWANRATGVSALAQGTSGSRPTRAATSFNGLPGVTFDGGDDWLSGTLTASAGFRMSVFMLVQRGAGGDADARFVSLNNGSGNDTDDYKYAPLYHSGSGVVKPLVSYTTLPGVTLPANEPHIVGSVMLGENFGGFIPILDGVIPARHDFNWSAYVPSFAPSQIFVGGDNAGNRNADMIVRSLLVVQGLITRPEIEAICERLADAGGL